MTAAPRFAYDYEDLARVAAHLLAQREHGYPIQVGKGAMTAEAANAGIAAARAITADWAAVVAGAPLPDSEVPQAEKRRALEVAAPRAAELASRRPGQREARDYAECVAALLWHQQDMHGTSRIRWMHQLTLDLRVQAAAGQERAAA